MSIDKIPRTHFQLDLLERWGLLRIVRTILFPYTLQIITLAGLLWLCYVAFTTGVSHAGWARMLTYTNLAILGVWVLFWPGLLIITPLFGRVWCAICPLELIANLTRRIQRLLGQPIGRPIPSWLRPGTGSIALFAGMQILVQLFFVHQIPFYTGFVLLGLLLTAIITTLLFREPHTFCQAFCPAMPLLALYGRFSPLALHHKYDETCAHCATKDCLVEKNRMNLDGRSCPSYLRPDALTPADNCTLCFQCAKVCPHTNIGWGITRRGLAARLLAPIGLPLAIYVFIELGFVLQQLWGGKECVLVRTVYPHLIVVFAWLRELPLTPLASLCALLILIGSLWLKYSTRKNRIAWLMLILGGSGGLMMLLTFLDSITGIIALNTLWLLVGFPIALASLLFSITRMTGNQYSFISTTIKLAPALLPVAAGGHIAKAIIELNLRLPYLTYAFQQDPQGITVAHALDQGTQGLIRTVWLGNTGLSSMLFGIMSVGFGISLYLILTRLEPRLRVAAYLGAAGMQTVYFVLLTILMSDTF